jgi:hypothetical protein
VFTFGGPHNLGAKAASWDRFWSWVCPCC